LNVKPDGSHWQIFGDQLFLFYAQQGRERWLTHNTEDYKETADIAWADILENADD
jgi:hypothetical protein